MITYKCSNCNSFLARITDKNNMQFKAKKGIVIKDNILILKCKCGKKTKIDLTQISEGYDENKSEWTDNLFSKT